MPAKKQETGVHLSNACVDNAGAGCCSFPVCAAVWPGGARSLCRSREGRRCRPSKIRLLGALGHHRAPVQRGAHPVARQDRIPPGTAPPADRPPGDQDQEGEENHGQAGATHPGLEPAASEATAPGATGTAFATTGSRPKSRSYPHVLRLEEAVSRSISPERKRFRLPRRMEAGLDRSPLESVLRSGLEGCNRRVSELRRQGQRRWQLRAASAPAQRHRQICCPDRGALCLWTEAVGRVAGLRPGYLVSLPAGTAKAGVCLSPPKLLGSNELRTNGWVRLALT